jgi:hypothetical protein
MDMRDIPGQIALVLLLMPQVPVKCLTSDLSASYLIRGNGIYLTIVGSSIELEDCAFLHNIAHTIVN